MLRLMLAASMMSGASQTKRTTGIQEVCEDFVSVGHKKSLRRSLRG